MRANLTLLHLSSKKFDASVSPLLSFSRSTTKSSFSSVFVRSKFSSSNFLFSVNPKMLTEFRNCHFEKYLASAIRIDKDAFMIGKVYEYTRQDLKDEPIRIYNSIFRYFDLRDQTGGAIQVKYKLRIYNALFKQITCKVGPAFACYDEVECVYSTFQSLEALEQCGAFLMNTRDYKPLSIEYSSFSVCSTIKYGLFNSEADGKIAIKNTNATRIKSLEVGVCQIQGDTVDIGFCSFYRCSTTGPNGGIVSKHPSVSFNCHYTSFYAVSQAPRGAFSASSLFLTEQGQTLIDSCTFIRNTGHPSIAASDGSDITLKKCCFSGKESLELKAKQTNFIKTGCSFETSQQINLANYNNDLGYIENRPFTQEGQKAGMFNLGSPEQEQPLLVLVVKLFIISLVLGVGLAKIVSIIQKKLGPKVPHALD